MMERTYASQHKSIFFLEELFRRESKEQRVNKILLTTFL